MTSQFIISYLKMVVNPETGILTTIVATEDPLTTIIQHIRTAVFCAPEKHHYNIEINHNEMQHHFEVNILKLCEKCQCPLSFPRFAAIAVRQKFSLSMGISAN